MMMVHPGMKLHQGVEKVLDGVLHRGCDEKKDKTNQPQISSSLQLALRGRWEEGWGQRLSCSPQCLHVCVCACMSLCL